MRLRTADQSDDASSPCSEFLALYGEYVDGTLQGVVQQRLSAHVDACDSCARYDRIIRRGAGLARDFMTIEPSPEFEQRLQHRIFHEQDMSALQGGRPAAISTALAVAAMIALVAWSPVLIAERGTSVPSEATVRAGIMTRGAASFTGSSTWYSVPATTSNAMLAAFPGPHSPLVVTPPTHRRVRTVSAEYAPVE